jgi:hypothetical protein
MIAYQEILEAISVLSEEEQKELFEAMSVLEMINFEDEYRVL